MRAEKARQSSFEFLFYYIHFLPLDDILNIRPPFSSRRCEDFGI